MERVQSKNLFNFAMKGIAEGEVAEVNAQIQQVHSSGDPQKIGRMINELSLKHDEESKAKLLEMIRANNEGRANMIRSVPQL